MGVEAAIHSEAGPAHRRQDLVERRGQGHPYPVDDPLGLLVSVLLLDLLEHLRPESRFPEAVARQISHPLLGQEVPQWATLVFLLKAAFERDAKIVEVLGPQLLFSEQGAYGPQHLVVGRSGFPPHDVRQLMAKNAQVANRCLLPDIDGVAPYPEAIDLLVGREHHHLLLEEPGDLLEELGVLPRDTLAAAWQILGGDDTDLGRVGPDHLGHCLLVVRNRGWLCLAGSFALLASIRFRRHPGVVGRVGLPFLPPALRLQACAAGDLGLGGISFLGSAADRLRGIPVPCPVVEVGHRHGDHRLAAFGPRLVPEVGIVGPCRFGG